MNEENIDINNVEIDKLQQAIANMAENTDNSDSEQIIQNPMEIMDNLPEKEEKESDESNNKYKKYVLKIDKKYQEIIDKMNIDEREQYFNAMLGFYIENQPTIEKKAKLKDSIIHIIVVVLTVLIGLPLIFFITNQSIELTISNYKQTQTNFVNLYKDKGGIKKKDLTKLRNLK